MISMNERVNTYIKWKRGLGYQLKVESRELIRFAEFIDEIQYIGPITTKIALLWAQSAHKCSRLYQARRVEMVRTLAKYEVNLYPGTEIPPKGILGKAHIRTPPYIYSRDEILDIMQTACELMPVDGFRPRTAETFIGLLASTGMRVCEALKLKQSDVDFDKKTIYIRNTKFHKSRIIPVHRSTILALSKYRKFRDQYYPVPQSTRFFLSEKGKDLPYSTICYTFQKIRESLHLGANKTGRKPRLYDLRHTFACTRLLNWYEEEIDIHKMISALSIYLGHIKLSDTYWYLTGTPELFKLATKRFENFVCNGGENYE